MSKHTARMSTAGNQPSKDQHQPTTGANKSQIRTTSMDRINIIKKRTQIGALSAAACKLTPGQIELKVSSNKKKEVQEKNQISKEF